MAKKQYAEAINLTEIEESVKGWQVCPYYSPESTDGVPENLAIVINNDMYTVVIHDRQHGIVYKNMEGRHGRLSNDGTTGRGQQPSWFASLCGTYLNNPKCADAAERMSKAKGTHIHDELMVADIAIVGEVFKEESELRKLEAKLIKESNGDEQYVKDGLDAYKSLAPNMTQRFAQIEDKSQRANSLLLTAIRC